MFPRVTLSRLCNEINRFLKCKKVTVWSKLALRMQGWGSLLCPCSVWMTISAYPSLILMKVETFEQVETSESQGPHSFVCAAVVTAAPTAVMEGNSSILVDNQLLLDSHSGGPCSRFRLPLGPPFPAASSSCPGGAPPLPPRTTRGSVCPQAGPFAWMLDSWVSPAPVTPWAPAAASLGEDAPLSFVQTCLWHCPGPYCWIRGVVLPFQLNSLLRWFHFLLRFRKTTDNGNSAAGQHDCLQLRFRSHWEWHWHCSLHGELCSCHAVPIMGPVTPPSKPFLLAFPAWGAPNFLEVFLEAFSWPSLCEYI